MDLYDSGLFCEGYLFTASCVANIDPMTIGMKAKARDFALEYHGEQKYGRHPYIVHLDAVAELVQQYGETAVVIAYLHDVVEDTSVSLLDIEKEFGRLIADCVAVLTDEPGEDRKERKVKTYAKMARVYGGMEIALLVKAADRLANVRACVADKKGRLLKVYKAEYLVFKEAVYRPGMCEKIWVELTGLVGEESVRTGISGMQG